MKSELFKDSNNTFQNAKAVAHSLISHGIDEYFRGWVRKHVNFLDKTMDAVCVINSLYNLNLIITANMKSFYDKKAKAIILGEAFKFAVMFFVQSNYPSN